MPRSVHLSLAYEAIHETLTAQREQVARIVEEDKELIARSRRAIENSRALLRETEHLVSDIAAKLERLDAS